MKNIQLPRLGASLSVKWFDQPLENCPFCEMKIQEDAFHEWDEFAKAWRCKTILESRGE